MAVRGDVADPATCARLVERGRGRCWPSSTSLVNNAGVYGPMGRIEDVDWDEWVDGHRDQPVRAPC